MLDVFSVGRTCTGKGGVRFFLESTTVASLDISGSRVWVRWRSGGPGSESVSSGLYIPECERGFQLPLPSRAFSSWGRCGAWGVALPRYCTSPLAPSRLPPARPGKSFCWVSQTWVRWAMPENRVAEATPVTVHTAAALPWLLRQVKWSRATGSKDELKWYGLVSFSSSPGSASRWQSGRT